MDRVKIHLMDGTFIVGSLNMAPYTEGDPTVHVFDTTYQGNHIGSIDLNRTAIMWIQAGYVDHTSPHAPASRLPLNHTNIAWVEPM